MTDTLISLAQAIGIGASELVAFSGGGGKSSIMRAISEEITDGVVLTSTTKLSRREVERVSEVISYRPSKAPEPPSIRSQQGTVTSKAELYHRISEALVRSGSCLVVGEPNGDKVTGIPIEIPGEIHSLEGVDIVLVEADGSRRKPCKAPASHEPVIPPEATIVIPTVGLDAIGKPVSEIAHRPELVKAITRLGMDDPMTVEGMCRLIIDPNGGLKGIPQQSRVVPYINKVDSSDLLRIGRRVARIVLQEDRVDRVILGAVRSARPVREIHRRVTALVLAAGRSSRMGRPKQLLPWADTTVLGRTITNLQQSNVSEVLVISGSQAQQVQRIAAEYGVETLYNERFDSGGMISSVQVALRNLPANREAILVMLADQPMVEATTIDRILREWWEGKSELLAPAYEEKRGNPVLIGRPYFPELLSIPAGGAPRELLERHKLELSLVDVGTDTILHDLDDEDDYERWRPRSGQSTFNHPH